MCPVRLSIFVQELSLSLQCNATGLLCMLHYAMACCNWKYIDQLCACVSIKDSLVACCTGKFCDLYYLLPCCHPHKLNLCSVHLSFKSFSSAKVFAYQIHGRLCYFCFSDCTVVLYLLLRLHCFFSASQTALLCGLALLA